MTIPPFNLTRLTADLAEPLLERWTAQLSTAGFVGGPEVAEFERAFAEFLGSEGAVGVANGTDALVVALRALGAGPGDEVIVPAFTFIATGSAVALAGATPVFADVEPDTLNLDPASVEASITERTVGILPVHLFGRPYEVEAIRELAEQKGLWVVEDAAQAHGAEVCEVKVGNFGTLASWSFYPTKNLGAFGDAGAITGNDPELLERVRRIANHGRAEHYLHSDLGVNSRLDALQAAVLNLRLAGLGEINHRRRAIACRYHRALGELAGAGHLELLTDREATYPVYHQYTLLTDRRDALRDHLQGEGIGSAVYYPIPLHQQPALASWVPDGLSLPVAERSARRALSLPMFPELTDDEADRVGEAVRAFFG